MVDAMVDAVLDTMVDAMVNAVLDTMVDEMVDAIVEESVRNIMAKRRYSTPFTTRLGGGGAPVSMSYMLCKDLGWPQDWGCLAVREKASPVARACGHDTSLRFRFLRSGC